MLKKIALVVFILVSVLDIVGIIFNIPILIQIFKPFILLSLLFLYAQFVSNRNNVYIMALIFSFLGDVFLMFIGELYFMIGLVSFLMAHILFIKIVLKRIEKTSSRIVITSALPFLIVFILLIFILKDSLGEMLLPVIIYGLIISTFGTVAMVSYREDKRNLSLFMLIGAIIFMVSDSVLAINKFDGAVHSLEVVVMVTYILAQYYIYRSMVLSLK